MDMNLEFHCPHCNAMQRKDFRDILRTTVGCPSCQQSYTLEILRESLNPNQRGALEDTLTAKQQQLYGTILQIQDDGLRQNAMWIIDHLEESPQGLLIEALQHRVPYPAQCRETLNLLVQMDLITWHGSPGNEYVKRTLDED